MRNIPVKLRITIWLTLLMAVLAVLMSGFMISISNMVTSQTAAARLSQTVRGNLSQISYSDSRLNLKDGFLFYQNGVSTLVYSLNESLLAGQIPVSFTVTEPFQNGLMRTVSSNDEEYYVLDLCLLAGWDDGVWVRGLMEIPKGGQASRNLMLVVLVALPLFLALAALGSYWIARRAFRPLDSITSTAEAINEAKDLSKIGRASCRERVSINV